MAHPDGGPRRSGITPVECDVDNGLAQRIVAATEATFKAHRDKALRANCGNKLAKDETCGFVLVDLMTGCLAPRDDADRAG